MKRRDSFKFRKGILSIFCVIVLCISAIGIMLQTVEAGKISDDLYIYEAESLNDNPFQIVADSDASGGFAIIADLTIEGDVNLFESSIYIQFGGIFRYYIRAKSDTTNSIIVGHGDPSLENEEIFPLTSEYRWYKTEEFQILNDEPVILWAHTAHFNEYIDKIMLVRFKDNFGVETINKMGQVTDPIVSDTDGDSINDDEDIKETWQIQCDKNGDGDCDDVNLQEDYVFSPPIGGPLNSDYDYDDDGLKDIDEKKYGTDPTEKDTDLDGLTDYYEVSNEYFSEFNYEAERKTPYKDKKNRFYLPIPRLFTIRDKYELYLNYQSDHEIHLTQIILDNKGYIYQDSRTHEDGNAQYELSEEVHELYLSQSHVYTLFAGTKGWLGEWYCHSIEIQVVIWAVTSPLYADSDMDGIKDGWYWDQDGDCEWDGGEGYGEIGDPNNQNDGSITKSPVNVDVSNPISPEVWVEVDWMEESSSWDTAHDFVESQRNKVKKAFYVHGIRLGIDVGYLGGGEEVPHDDILFSDEFWSDYKDLYFESDRDDYFHYCLFGHQAGEEGNPFECMSTGGWGEPSGDDLFVADGIASLQLPEFQSHIFMHELGHNFGFDCYDFNPWSADSAMYDESYINDYNWREWRRLNMRDSI